MGYKVKKIYVGTQQVYPAAQEEKIEYRMTADGNGNLYVPTGGRSHTNSQDCTYSWKISVDGGTSTTYTGTGSSGGKITLSGYTANSSHRIKITPTTEDYGWALAYGWDTNYSISLNCTGILYDKTYMGYAISSTNTGDYFRSRQYVSVKFLNSSLEEYLPDTVLTVGTFFRYAQYLQSTITSCSDEYLPSSVTIIGDRFRATQYNGCTALIKSAKECLPYSITSIGTYFRYSQYDGCTALTEVTGWIDLSVGNATGYRFAQFNGCTSNKDVRVLCDVGYNSSNYNVLPNSYVSHVFVPSQYLTTFKNTSNYPWVDITDSKFVGY